MRYSLIFLLAGFLAATQPSLANEPARDFKLNDGKGIISLSQFQGKVVYLDFWASWCGPCRQSFPWMNAIQERFGADRFVVLAVNLDKERQQADKFIETLQPKFNIAYDPEGSVAESYKVQAMPSSYLIDRQGNVVSRHRGFLSKDTGSLENQIAQLLH